MFRYYTIFLALFLLSLIPVNGATIGLSPASIDTTFQFNGTNTPVINDILILPDGKIAFGGTEPIPWGILNSDGSSNVTAYPSPYKQNIYSLALSKEEIVLRGSTSEYMHPITRSNGQFEDSYFSSRSPEIGIARRIFIQNPEYDIVGAGTFTLAGQTNPVGLIRLKRMGALDSSFDSQSSAGKFFSTAAVNEAGQILGSYTYTNETGKVAFNLGRWFEDGKSDTNYSTEWLASIDSNARVTAITREPGLDSFIAAVEYSREAATNSRLVRLDSAGAPTQSSTFPEILGSINAIGFCPAEPARTNDGAYEQILVGGSFSRVGGTSCHNLVSLSNTGDLLWMFQPDEGPNGPINAVIGQTDGRILIGGAFDQVSGVPAIGLARLQGLGAMSKTYVFWEKTEYHGFEKLGSVELVLNRRGKTDVNLPVSVRIDPAGAARIGWEKTVLTFAPGEIRKAISIPILQNESRDGRVTAFLRPGPVESEVDNSVSYNGAALTILDDETAGTIDPFFPSSSPGFVWAVARQPDGKMLLSYTLEGPHIMRLNTDGSIDSSFFTNGVPFTNKWDAYVSQIEVLPDSRIYVAGTFITTTGYGTNLVARLNPDGTLDSSFNPRLSPSHEGPTVLSPGVFALQPDGKLLVWQNSLSFDLRHEQVQQQIGSYNPPFRLNSDGTVDLTFRISGIRGIGASAVQKDGQILFFGNNGFHRYAKDGKQQTNFMAQITGSIYQIRIDGNSLLVSGSFNQINGISVSNLARLDLQTGALDRGFSCQTDGPVSSVLVREDGKIYIAGDFTKVNGGNRYRMARLNQDGGLDLAYDPGMGFSQTPKITLQGDGKLLVASGAPGNIPVYADRIRTTGLVLLEDSVGPGKIQLVSHRIIAKESEPFALVALDRLGGSRGELSAEIKTLDGSAMDGLSYVSTNATVTFSDGEFGRKFIRVPLLVNSELTGNKTFSISLNNGTELTYATVLVQDDQIGTLAPGLTVQLDSPESVIHDFVSLPNGSILLGGVFNSIQGIPMTNLARLNPDFSVDTSFVLQGLDVPPISRLLVRTDGQIILGGPFTKAGSSNWGPVVQINADLTYDVPFNNSIRTTWGSPRNEPTDLKLSVNGSLYSADTGGLRRILTNGVKDTSFRPSFIAANCLLPLSGETLLVGTFSRSQTLARLTANGMPETTFVVNADYKTSSAAAIQSIESDGETGFYIGGDFTRVNAFQSPRLAHIYTDGTVDTNFIPNIGTNSDSTLTLDSVRAIAVLGNGDILAGGNFLQAGGREQRLIALLNGNGQLKPDFQPDLRGTSVQKISVLPNGDALVLGSITHVNGVDTDGLFELRFAKELPPIVQLLSPISGTNFNVSDVVVPFEIKVHAFDPDNFLKEVRIDLDGTPIATNQIGDFSLNMSMPGAGPHQLKATALDDAGLISSASVNFTVTSIPFPASITISQAEEGIIISYSGSQLQESDDLETWTNVQGAGSGTLQQYKVIPGAAHRFYRLLK